MGCRSDEALRYEDWKEVDGEVIRRRRALGRRGRGWIEKRQGDTWGGWGSPVRFRGLCSHILHRSQKPILNV